MTIAVYLPFVMSMLLALAARPWARHLAPGPGARGLAIAAAVVAVSTCWSLSLLVISLIDDLPATPLLEKTPVPDGVSLLAGAALTWSGARLVIAVLRRRELRRSLAPVVASGQGELVVVRDLTPHAFAVAGKPGRIVVSAAMLRALTAPQRRAMLAHERGHLQRGHPTLLALADLAAAANPLLLPARTAVGYLCERHADEIAAADVGDRFVVAEALAAAAFATTAPPPVAQPAFHRVGVVDRVAALVAPPRRYRSAGLFTATAIALIALASACDATDQFYELVRQALAL
jgi:Zn-dependent protease with chaperone function